mgnify:CR=1 FL=1
MTISTTLFYDRAVTQLATNKSDLAALQEKVATGKEINRPSDSVDTALSVSRLKETISTIDGFSKSLNAVNDRLRIEESYIQGVSDVLTKIKTLTIQAANASYNASDRSVIALEIRELTDEIKNLANGTDPSGNHLFAGTRVRNLAYEPDADGIIRYQGDQVETNLNFTASRKSNIGRSGPDVFQSVVMGRQPEAVPAQYRLTTNANPEAGDRYALTIEGIEVAVSVEAGQTLPDVYQAIAEKINEFMTPSGLEQITASSSDTGVMIESSDGLPKKITFLAINGGSDVGDQRIQVESVNTPDPGPLRMEFFESLQEVARFIETGSQDQIQSKLYHLDQMQDISTRALADLGVEMQTIDTELALNDELKASLQATLSSEEDLDYTKTITELQARLLSLEAAQSSFAQISRLSVFDYLR